MIGAIGSGKTTYARRLAKESNLVYLSPDDYWDRSSIHEFSDEISIESWARIYARIYQCIKRGQDFIVDSAQRNRRSRRELTGVIKSMAHGEYKITGIFLKRDYDECLAGVRTRKESVPEEKICEYYESLQKEPPTLGDGFDEIIEVDCRDGFSG
jgi:predicted kinase